MMRSSSRSFRALCMDGVRRGASVRLHSTPYRRSSRRSTRSISAPWWVPQNHASSCDCVRKTCSMTKPSQDAPILGCVSSAFSCAMPKEVMQEAAVSYVYLRRFHLSLLEVRMPRLKLPHHESVSQQVDVSSARGWTHTECLGRLSGIPCLPVVVGEHGPKAEQRDGRDLYAPLRQISLQQRQDELLAPCHARRVASGETGARESATKPETRGRIHAQLLDGEFGDDHLLQYHEKQLVQVRFSW